MLEPVPSSGSESWVHVRVQLRGACLPHTRSHGRTPLWFLGGRRRQRRCGVQVWACWGVEHERTRIACTLGGSASVVNPPVLSVGRRVGAGATEHRTESDRNISTDHCWRGQSYCVRSSDEHAAARSRSPAEAIRSCGLGFRAMVFFTIALPPHLRHLRCCDYRHE